MWHAGKCDLLAYGNEQLQKVVHKYAILMHEVTQTDGRDSLRILPQRFRNQKLLHGKNIKYSQFDTDISNVTDRTVKVYGTYSYSYIKIRLLSKMKRERGNSCLSIQAADVRACRTCLRMQQALYNLEVTPATLRAIGGLEWSEGE